ncbi:hypothetical protein JXL83_06680 [candidate division WOR-3 bacterium]|nr:hypothetical protein [candidate division WOR-3 bacterium]
MDEFFRNFNSKAIAYSFYSCIAVFFWLLALFSVFFSPGLVWAIFAGVSFLSGVLSSLLRKNTIVSEFDAMAEARGLIKASHEFCTLELPGSDELKEKTAETGLGFLKSKNLFIEKLLDIAGFFVLSAVLIFVPRFGVSVVEYYGSQKFIPSGDTTVYWGQDLRFSIFPVKAGMDLHVIADGETLDHNYSEDTFFAFCREIEKNTHYYFVSGTDTLAKGFVNVISPPIEFISASIELPSYIAQTEYPLEFKNKYLVPEGSVLKFELFSAANAVEWKISGAEINKETSVNTVIFEFPASESSCVFVEALTVLGDTLHLDFIVAVIKDLPPDCRITYPPEKILRAGDLSEFDIKITARDDYGLTYAELIMSRTDNTESFQGLFLKGKGPLEVNFLLNAGDFTIKPGETAFVFAAVKDNRPSPQTGFSDTILLIMPTLYEIFISADSSEKADFERAVSFREKGSEIMRDLELLEQRLILADSLSFSDRENFEEVLKKHRLLVDEMSKALDEMRAYFDASMESYMLDSLVFEKSAEIARLYEEVLDEQTKEAFEKLYELAENADENEMSEILGQLKLESGDLLESLEKTLNLLKRLELEKKLEELARRALEIANVSAEIETNNQELATRQLENVRDELERILDEVSDLDEDMMGEKAATETQSASREGEMALQENEKALASAEPSDELTEKLSSMASHLQKASQSMSGMRRGAASTLVKEMMECMLGMSELEESIHNKELSPVFSSASLASCVRTKNTLDSLSSLTSLIETDLGRILADMENELRKPEEQIKHIVIMKLANDAYKSLERMNRMMENTMSCGNSGMLQQLSEMGGEQAQINSSLTRILGSQNLTQRQLAEMGAYQRALSQKLSEMSGQTQGSARILSELEEIARQMELSAKAIERGDISRDLVERQRGILQRLLESQRSMREQQTRPVRTAQRPEGHYAYPFFTGIDNYLENEKLIMNSTVPFTYGANPELFWKHFLKRYYDAGF